MSIERQNYALLGKPAGPYSQAVIHQNTLYTSGLTAFGCDAEDADIAEQAQAIFKQLNHIAEYHNISLQDLIKVTIFVTEMTDITSLRSCLERNYDGVCPASSMLKVDSLFAATLKIEIEAIFAL